MPAAGLTGGAVSAGTAGHPGGRTDALPGPAGRGVKPDFDVTVIGAGVVGCAIARELAGYPIRVGLLDAADDVGDVTSKANTAILHTGFDATPGTLESTLVARGYQLLTQYAAASGIPLRRTGAWLVAWDTHQVAVLPTLLDKAQSNGYQRARQVSPVELYQDQPHLGPGALGAIEVPDEAIICPWTTTLAYACEAVTAGVDLRLSTTVTAVRTKDHPSRGHELQTTSGPVTTRWLVNAAGLGADRLNAMLGRHEFTVTARAGELIVFDKLATRLVDRIILATPTSKGKGVLVAPTVYGNVLLGPTAQDRADRTDTTTTAAGLHRLLEQGGRLVPELVKEEVTAVYAGVRAATEHSDYQLRAHPDQRYVCVGGIRSTGLTASMAIAEHTVALLRDAGCPLGTRRETQPTVLPNIGEDAPRAYQRSELISADSEYGRIVCHCERVTRGEIRDALASSVPPRTMEGVRRRTRAGMGRCQGFYCAASVRAMLRARS